MSALENKILIQNYVEKVWNQADLAAFKMFTTPNFTYQIGGQAARNGSAMEQFILATHSAFPDWHIEIVDMISEDNKVAIRWQGQVTHEGSFIGIPPTGKRITVSGINTYHISNGKVASEWEQTDTISMLRQMGILE